jgi:hypothetical protein
MVLDPARKDTKTFVSSSLGLNLAQNFFWVFSLHHLMNRCSAETTHFVFTESVQHFGHFASKSSLRQCSRHPSHDQMLSGLVSTFLNSSHLV